MSAGMHGLKSGIGAMRDAWRRRGERRQAPRGRAQFDLRGRLVLVTGALGVCALALVARAVDLQLVRNEFYQKQGDERFLREIEIATSRGKEAWQGQEYKVGNDIFTFAGMQVVRWLNVFAGGGVGPGIYYDEEDPFQGRTFFSFFGFTLQPNQHITQSIEGNYNWLDRASTGERIYDVTVLNAKTTYQFDKHFLVRFLAQYDSSEHRLLTDFLASYELVPGTVFHAGYGSLYERGVLDEAPAGAARPVRLEENYRATNRGLFFKASYLRRF